MAVIEVEGLRKEYRRLRGGSTIALDGLDLSVAEGGVYGFLGPNGAGKTTTIRCLLGLVRPTAGRASLLGRSGPTGLRSVISKVGSMVETPSFMPTMSGRRNLELLGAIDGIGRRRVREALDAVGLGERADDPVRAYSLGMKQRLGIAAALLKDPTVLILDEPANGLDPAGIKEVRELLRRLGAEGRTVFVSSHILPEIQHMADRVAIVARGRRVADGSVADVLASRASSGVIVRATDLEAAERLLTNAGLASTRDGDHLRVSVDPKDAAHVTRVLAWGGVYVSELRPLEADLETVFLELTDDGGRV